MKNCEMCGTRTEVDTLLECLNPRGCLNNTEIISENYKQFLHKDQWPKWISVKDHLPLEGELVLIHRIGERLTVDYRIEIEGLPTIWACLLEDEIYKVTHWMPLPERPNG